jgi:Zn-dependent peptidase ImmA (M78 family)/fido (protein-threonine AMPylation protein)
MIENITPAKLAKKTLQNIKNKNGEIKFPIDPFKLLKDNGVLISFSNFEKLEGVILNDEDDVTIVGINRLRPWTRQRFSAAHEYCHFIKDLEKGKNEISKIECLIGSKDEIEKFADKFASELLMPEYELKSLCNQYKNDKGYVDFDNVIYIAEYFGVSFESCIFRIAYSLKMIDGEIESKELKKRIKNYHPDIKRKKLIQKNNDFLLIGNAIDSFFYCMVDLNKNIGNKFINNYIYYDNKLEGIDQKEVSYILSDLLFNKEKSKFFNSSDEKIIMTLGNYSMQEYVLTTDDELEIFKCKKLHKLLFSYTLFPEYSGNYRNEEAIILEGTIQPISYIEINRELEKLNNEFNYFKKNIDNYKVSEYIENVVYFIYKFIKIHPFSDGNGRVSRALLNWMLRLKNIPPIYIDDKCKKDYYTALSTIDLEGDYVPMILLVEKRIINTLAELHDYLFMEEMEEQEYVAKK